MSNENDFFYSAMSPNETARSVVMVSDETARAINDQEDAFLMVRNENITVQTTPTNNENRSIEIGSSVPLESGNNPNPVLHDQLFENQPIELNEYHGESPDEIFQEFSPINLTADDHEVPLSPQILNVTNYGDILYHNDAERLVEPVRNQDNETIATQPIENLIQHELINNEINYNLDQPTILTDLTQDDNDTAEANSVQLTSNTDNTENDRSVDIVSPREPLPLVTGSSLEANDQHTNIANETDNSDQTIETTAQLQRPILVSRINRRSNSSDEFCHKEKRHRAGRGKRRRKSVT